MTEIDKAWEKLFDEYKILPRVERDGFFKISAAQIENLRESRLVTKFDHRVNLPKIFSSNELTILPVTRGDYVISHFDAWKNFEPSNSLIIQVTLPDHLQSFDALPAFNEKTALSFALASGIIADFTGDENILPTTFGRMPSGTFDFKINDTRRNFSHAIHVEDCPIEISAVFEGINFLIPVEAELDATEAFLIRRLYYPYRALRNKFSKPIKPIMLVYSDGIFHLREYAFAEPENYNSIRFVQQKRYTRKTS